MWEQPARSFCKHWPSSSQRRATECPTQPEGHGQCSPAQPRGSPGICWVGHYLLDVQQSPSQEHCNTLEAILRPKHKMSWEWKREICVHDKKFSCGEELQELDSFCGKWMNCLVVRISGRNSNKKEIKDLFHSNICMWNPLKVQNFPAFLCPKFLVILPLCIMKIFIVLIIECGIRCEWEYQCIKNAQTCKGSL